jgi:MFS family permease
VLVAFAPLIALLIPVLTTRTTVFGTSSIVKGKVTWAVAGPLLGIISASYNLGAILAVPIVPWIAQRVGRRWSILIGSCFQCIGAIIQAFSVDGESLVYHG